MKPLFELAADVHRRWLAWQRDPSALPEAAMAALAERPISEHLDAKAICDFVAGAPQLPTQLDPGSNFGDPPVTLYNDGVLAIDAYFWLTSSVAIHQHAFAGVFVVLEGSSVEAEYDFEVSKRYSHALVTGRLRRRALLVNRKGDVRPIAPGDRFIHSLFHLDYPSVSLVVRTDLPAALPQLEYWPPSIGIQSGQGRPVLRRRIELLSMLGATQPDALAPFLRRAMADAPAHDVLPLLKAALPLFKTRLDEFNALLREAKSVHGEVLDAAVAAFKAEGHVESLTTLRAEATGPDARLFLGLLLCAETRADLLELLRLHSSREPVEEGVRLLSALLDEASLAPRAPKLAAEERGWVVDAARGLLAGRSADEVRASVSSRARPARLDEVFDTPVFRCFRR